MKPFVALLICSVCFSGLYAQQSVSVHGPFTPDGKFSGDGSQSMHLVMKISGDTATLSGLKQAGMPDTIVLSVKTASTYTVTTGKMDDKGKYDIAMVADTHSQSTFFDNRVISKEQTVSLFGTAKQDEMPHYDSIEITPKGALYDSAKQVLIKAFQSIGTLQLPHKKLRIGDTASMNVTMPIQFAMVNETILATEIFKLVNIKNGLAYFDISISMKFNGAGNASLNLQMKGSGEGSGNCVYDIQNMYFKTLNTDMNFTVPFAMNIERHTIEGTARGNTKVSVNFSKQ